jgi:CAAX prenyl protease-like protein
VNPETPTTTPRGGFLETYPSIPYILPFVVFLLFLVIQDRLAFLGSAEYTIRITVLVAVLFFFSRHVIDLRVTRWVATTALGVAVFLVWIAPDTLWAAWRQHWLFQNAIMGKVGSSVPESLRGDMVVLVSRALRAVVLVPIIEELFWRAWLMRWLISKDFRSLPLGTYSAEAFWLTAVLFASEHGSYWEVGLAAGIAYNWWMLKTRSLGDLILAHAVTNGCLSLYVVCMGKWEYW